MEVNSGVKKGCLGFIVVLAILGLGAGLSVVIRGKNLKPKSRALMIARPERTLDKIKNEFAADVTEADRRKFEEAYRQLTSDMIKSGNPYQDRFGEAAEELARIRSDGKITAEETERWIQIVLKTKAGNSPGNSGIKPPAVPKSDNR